MLSNIRTHSKLCITFIEKIKKKAKWIHSKIISYIWISVIYYSSNIHKALKSAVYKIYMSVLSSLDFTISFESSGTLKTELL